MNSDFRNLNGKTVMPRESGAFFIVFEGSDGSGQSTQAALLRDLLTKKGYPVVLTKEPTSDSEPGRKAREMLVKKISPSAKDIQRLITEDRGEHLKKTIIPALQEGKVVVSDRYFFSTLAYGTADGLDFDWLFEINKSFLYPDMIFLLRVDPKVCMERVIKRGRTVSVFEEEKKLAVIWNAYKNFPERFPNFHLIDGEGSIEEVAGQIKEVINRNFFK
jgi:dTMP kinase